MSNAELSAWLVRARRLLAVSAGAAFLLAPITATSQIPANPSIVISTGSHAVLGGTVTVENEDLALCHLTSFGFQNTHCDWSLFFDGSAAGLNSAVKALDVLPNGNLVMRVAADHSIPDLSTIRAKDLALFIPVDPRHPPLTARANGGSPSAATPARTRPTRACGTRSPSWRTGMSSSRCRPGAPWAR